MNTLPRKDVLEFLNTRGFRPKPGPEFDDDIVKLFTKELEGQWMRQGEEGLSRGTLLKSAQRSTASSEALAIDAQITPLIDDIAAFRKKKGLPKYVPQNKSTGTVTRIEINNTRYYDRNSGLEGYTRSIGSRREWLRRLKEDDRLDHIDHLGQQDARFLNEAEADALIQAFEAGEVLPKRIVMVLDRPTCNVCQGNAGELLDYLGVDELMNWKSIGRMQRIHHLSSRRQGSTGH